MGTPARLLDELTKLTAFNATFLEDVALSAAEGTQVAESWAKFMEATAREGARVVSKVGDLKNWLTAPVARANGQLPNFPADCRRSPSAAGGPSASARGPVLRNAAISDTFARARSLAGAAIVQPPGRPLLDEILAGAMARPEESQGVPA